MKINYLFEWDVIWNIMGSHKRMYTSWITINNHTKYYETSGNY